LSNIAVPYNKLNKTEWCVTSIILPVFPSDNGRILSALLSKHNNQQDHVRGTKGATRIGVIVSLGLVLVGIIIDIGYSFLSGLWPMILAFFLIKQSKWYYRQYQDVPSQIYRTDNTDQ
jgi:Zn-dependent protease